MAQRKASPAQSAIEVAANDAALVPDAVFASSQLTNVPARTQVQIQRVLTRQEFRKTVGINAIEAAAEVSDVAHEQVTGSFLYANHLRRGFNGEMDETQEATFNELSRSLGRGVAAITNDTLERIEDLAKNAELPSEAVTKLDTAIQWMKTH